MFVFIWNIGNSQINNFQFEGCKDYEDGSRIAYFYISGLNSIHQAVFVQKELRKHELVLRFYIYQSNTDSNRCMIETYKDINEGDIRKMINDVIGQYEEFKMQFKDDKWEFFKIVYEIPEDFPLFKYYPLTDANRDNFIEETKIWMDKNPDKFKEIKHLKNEIDGLNRKNEK